MGTEELRIEPDAHRECSAAQNLGFLNAGLTRQSWLHNAIEKVGYLVGLQNVRCKR